VLIIVFMSMATSFQYRHFHTVYSLLSESLSTVSSPTVGHLARFVFWWLHTYAVNCATLPPSGIGNI
jgi:hypothetical protein